MEGLLDRLRRLIDQWEDEAAEVLTFDGGEDDPGAKAKLDCIRDLQNVIKKHPRRESNAALIAAAPDLLAACEQVASWILIAPEFQDWPAVKSYLNQINAVIAKAKSEAK